MEDSPGSAEAAQPCLSDKVMRFLSKHKLKAKASQGDSELQPDTPQQLQVGHAGCCVGPQVSTRLCRLFCLCGLQGGTTCKRIWDVGRCC